MAELGWASQGDKHLCPTCQERADETLLSAALIAAGLMGCAAQPSPCSRSRATCWNGSVSGR
jgi:hypothetical protein